MDEWSCCGISPNKSVDHGLGPTKALSQSIGLWIQKYLIRIMAAERFKCLSMSSRTLSDMASKVKNNRTI